VSDLQFSDVVLVAFPFTDQLGTKHRPAVVVSSSLYQRSRPDVILMAVTSSAGRHGRFGDVPVAEWVGAGLLKPSTIKPVFATVERSLVRRRLGKLAAADSALLRKSLTLILG